MLDEFKQCQLNRDAYVDRKVLEFEEEERKRGMGRVDQQTLNFKRVSKINLKHLKHNFIIKASNAQMVKEKKVHTQENKFNMFRPTSKAHWMS